MRFHPSAFLVTLAFLVASIAFAPAAAAAPESNYWVSFTDDFDSCSGERVVVTGEQHIVERVTVDGTGQKHFVFHRNTYGTGIGTVSGADYLLLDTVSKIDRVDTVEGDTTVSTQLYETVFVRQGETTSNDDSYVRMVTRVTIAPDGTQTTEIEFVSVACR